MSSMLPPPAGDPKDTKNLMAAIILSLLVIVGWQYFYEKPRQEQIRAAQTQQQLAAATAGTAPEQVPVLPEASSPALVTTPLSRTEAIKATPRVSIQTGNLHGSINLRGGRFDDLTLVRYRETVDPESPEIVLLSPAGSEAPYYAELGWRAGAGVVVPDAETLWQADKFTLSAGETVTLSWDNGAGLRFERKISLDDQYLFTITQSVHNSTATAVNLHGYGLIARTFDPAYSSLYLQHEGPIAVFDGQLVEHDYNEVAQDKLIKQDSTGGWLGFTDKYWLVALVPEQTAQLSTRTLHVPQVSDQRFQMDYLAQATLLAPGQSQSVTTHLFAGAKEVRALDRYQSDLKIPHFDLAIDFGWFYFLTKPFFYALDLLSGWLGSFALGILAFTVLLKLALFKLADHSYVSMAKMKNVMPRLQEIRETYANDTARQSQEMMALYKKEGINPASGCWPILIQIPIFFALYKVLYVSIEMRHAPFYGWIRDMSAMDPSNLFTLFGLLSWTPPSGLHIGIFPLLMGLTMWLQMKMSPPPTDPTQRMIIGFMPILLTVSLSHMAAGLVIYWTWSNILSILQQFIINRRMKVRML